MADVFVSYAHQDRDWVSLFTTRLQEAGGWNIWWDRTILPGEQFDDAIQAALAEARRVIVVWSAQSAASRWVRTEARDAAQRNVLLPVRIDDVVLPLEFRSFETADMSRWRGDPQDPEFLELVEALRSELAGGAARTVSGSPSAVTVLPTRRRRTPPAAAALMPQFTYGTWTLHRAVDEQGTDWSNSVIKFEKQEPAEGGLTLKGTFTWRLDNVLIGSETFTGHYIAATRQLILEGESVTDVRKDTPARLAVGSYSAILAPDERSLSDGRWGSTSKSDPGVAGHWEATR